MTEWSPVDTVSRFSKRSRYQYGCIAEITGKLKEEFSISFSEPDIAFMHVWLEDHLGYVDVNNFGTSMIRL